MQKVSPEEEHRITRAIEKAAALATVNEEHDRSSLIAGQLRQEGVDRKFAKTAAAAFNKRLTVLTFQHTDDDHKADTFPLADPDVVYSLLGGTDVQEKTASAQKAAFSIGITRHAMEKAAAERKAPVKVLYEDRTTAYNFVKHLGSVMDKQAAEFQRINCMYEGLCDDIERQRRELNAEFAKTAYASFDFETLAAVYGDTLGEALGKACPVTGFTKRAAVLPSGGVFDKVASLVEAVGLQRDAGAAIAEWKEGLAEFAKSAMIAELSLDPAYMEKTAVTNAERKAATRDLALASAALVPAALMDVGALAGSTVGSELNNFANIDVPTYRRGMSNALALINAARADEFDANKVLDSDFLSTERYRDRLLAWSDMTADPLFSMYPSRQVFSATQKAMNSNLSLERPDNRELLRTQVGTLLAQNNRFSAADIAATAQTTKALEQSGIEKLRELQDLARLAGKASKKEAPSLQDIYQPVTSVDTGKSMGLSDAALKNAWSKLRERRKTSISAAGDKEGNTRLATKMAISAEMKKHNGAKTFRLVNGGRKIEFLDAAGKNVFEVDLATLRPDIELNMQRIELVGGDSGKKKS